MACQVQQLFTSSIRATAAPEDDSGGDAAVQQLMQHWATLEDDEDNCCELVARAGVAASAPAAPGRAKAARAAGLRGRGQSVNNIKQQTDGRLKGQTSTAAAAAGQKACAARQRLSAGKASKAMGKRKSLLICGAKAGQDKMEGGPHPQSGDNSAFYTWR
eukprot:gene9123-9292_t